MKYKNICLGLVTTLTLSSTAWAQMPAPPSAGGAGGAGAGAGGGGVPALPAGGSGGNIWSFLLPNAQQKQNLKNCWCKSPLGQLMAGAAMGAMSGGLIKSCCAQNQLNNDLATKPADSPGGIAAQIKKDEADAKE